MRRALLYVGGWLVAVVVATGVGFAAVSLVGDDVGSPGSTVAFAAVPRTTPTPTADEGTSTSKPRSTPRSTKTSNPSSDGGGDASSPVTQVSDAGTVTGLCRDELPRLVSWSPKNGWSVLDVDSAGTRRSVSFGDGSSYVTVTLRCISGVPTFAVVTTDASPTPEPTETSEPTPTPTVSVPGDQP
jgi:hypothetical protein